MLFPKDEKLSCILVSQKVELSGEGVVKHDVWDGKCKCTLLQFATTFELQWNEADGQLYVMFNSKSIFRLCISIKNIYI